MSPRSNAEDTAATHASLLVRGREAFATLGYARTSLDDVVRAARVTKGALYHHFGSKQGLFEAVVRDLEAELVASVTASAALASDPWDELTNVCRSYLEASLDPGVRQILLIDAPAVLGVAAATTIDDELAVKPLENLLRELAAAGRLVDLDTEALAHLLNGALIDAALWLGGQAQPQAALGRAMQALEALLDGIARGRAPRRRSAR